MVMEDHLCLRRFRLSTKGRLNQLFLAAADRRS